MAASISLIKFRPILTWNTSCKVFFHSSRCLDESHYDVLKLDQSCSDKEIRNAFIALSKQFHPDANQKNSQAHSQFIKINEAYSVLSKPTSRREYDFLLENEAVVHRNKSWEAHNTTEERPWRDETIWHMRDRSQDGNYQSKPYYGIHGIKRLSNTWIVVACLVFTALGVGLQVLAIRSSFTMSREVLEKRSQENGITHQAVRQQAEMNGNSRQIQLLKQRLQPVSATD